MLGKKKVTLQFSVNWLICIFGVGAILVGMFIWGPSDWHPDLVFAAAVLAGAAGFTTALNNLDQRVAQGKQARILAALQFADRWNSPQFFHCKKNGREIILTFRQTPSVEKQLEYVTSDSVRLANLLDILNLFESLNIAIENEVVDDDIARRFFRSIVIEYWHTTEQFVKKRRAEKGNSRLNCEFEALYERWKN